nr:hypothetical protein [Tanacetum cinerariifolium]
MQQVICRMFIIPRFYASASFKKSKGEHRCEDAKRHMEVWFAYQIYKIGVGGTQKGATLIYQVHLRRQTRTRPVLLQIRKKRASYP